MEQTEVEIFDAVQFPENLLEVLQGFIKDYDYSDFPAESQKGKLYERVFIQKASEWVAYKFLKNYLSGLSRPNMDIYYAGHRPIVPELKSDILSVYVRGTRESYKQKDYSKSDNEWPPIWLFPYDYKEEQLADKKDQDMITNHGPNDILVLASILLDKANSVYKGRIRTILPMNQISEGNIKFFQTPSQPWLKEDYKIIHMNGLNLFGLNKNTPDVLLR